MLSMKEFCERLRELRLSRGLSQRDTANLLGVSRSAYANYEQGTREPSFVLLVRICREFHVSSDDLLGIVDDIS